MTREELKAEALINLGSEPAPKEWEKLPCIKEQMPSCIGGEVSLQRFVGTDICAWFVGIGGLWEPQSDYFRVSLPPAEGAEDIRQLLLGWEHYKRDHLRESEALDVEAILLSEYSQIAAQPQPTAEGAEEILLRQRNGEDKPITYAVGKGGWVYKMILRAMTEFATLHAQKLADKMVDAKTSRNGC